MEVRGYISLNPTVTDFLTMFAKLLIICAVAVAAFAAELPAGMHPAVCPNYPYCDMEVLARHTPEGIPIPDWELPYARMMPVVIPYSAKPGVFEYPFARIMPVERVYPKKKSPVPVESLKHTVEYPADVDPASCPNYPYCA